MTKVVLWIGSDESNQGEAQGICDILGSDYEVCHVIMRSKDAPLSLVLPSLDLCSPEIWVVLDSDDSALVSLFRRESPFPVLSMSEYPSGEAIAEEVAKICSLGDESVRNRLLKKRIATRQRRYVEDSQIRTRSPYYRSKIATCYEDKMQLTHQVEGLGDAVQVHRGKVRDSYASANHMVLVTTDRQSGFDRQLAVVPFKGAVLNMTSAYWFNLTKTIIPNHLVDVPHPNISIVRKCKPFPIEFVVR